jgi:DNA-binding response OmpR family regulator
MKVLYVENHARFARVVMAQFLSAHEVMLVPTLAAARVALLKSTYDALLVDYDLDDGSGIELVLELQHQPDRPIIIAVSAHRRGNEAMLAAGADASCEKLRFQEIATVLQATREKRAQSE